MVDFLLNERTRFVVFGNNVVAGRFELLSWPISASTLESDMM